MAFNWSLVFVLGCALSQAFGVPRGFLKPQANAGGEIWAVLAAGSNGYDNYRHQADIAHAYQILKDHGVKTENIITMIYDDIANDPNNPFPGKMFNFPHGRDVYAGLQVDYAGEAVSSANFLAVLQGNAAGVTGGNKKVIKSGPNDNIFVYFADHGAPGFVCFPDNNMDDSLTVDQLKQAVFSMYDKKLYKQMSIYIEACESGSMFDGIDYASKNVYALSAANATQSSWGVFCPPLVTTPGGDDPWNALATCLGDEFSVRWMSVSEQANLQSLTLEAEFKETHERTLGSHVTQWGNVAIAKEPVASFQGVAVAKTGEKAEVLEAQNMNMGMKWNSRDIPLHLAQFRARKETDPVKKSALKKKVTQAMKNRVYFDKFIQTFVSKFDLTPTVQQAILTEKPKTITKYECHTAVVKNFSKFCFKYNSNPYVLKYGNVLANLCEFGVDANKATEIMQQQCAGNKVQNII